MEVKRLTITIIRQIIIMMKMRDHRIKNISKKYKSNKNIHKNKINNSQTIKLSIAIHKISQILTLKRCRFTNTNNF